MRLLGDDLTDRIEAWAAAARVDDAARRRVRERWLRQAAEEGATLAGVLADLADQAAGVVLTTLGDRRHRGVVVAIGDDFAALGSEQGALVVVRLAAVSSVRAVGDGVAAMGDRQVHTGLRLVEVLAGLAAERAPALLRTLADDAVSGELRWVGQDVVALRTHGERPTTAYVPTAAITEVVTS